jgi:hypothetical protein
MIPSESGNKKGPRLCNKGICHNQSGYVYLVIIGLIARLGHWVPVEVDCLRPQLDACGT